jgi:5-methylcytosine-specific restriction endonuclease McrA
VFKISADREWHNEWVATRRKRALDYLGNQCVICGVTTALQFDHIDPDSKVFGIAGNLNRKWPVLKEELDKCQLLCQQHHREKTIRESSVEHGGGLSGKKNCPCALCKARKAEYMKTYNMRP